MGSRKACETKMEQALKKGDSVIVDRCNFDYSQRNVWVKLATKHNIKDITCLHLNIPLEVCKQRVTVRKDHPTIKDANSGISIIDMFASLVVPPSKFEGYVEVITVTTDEEVEKLVDKLSILPHS